MIDAELGITDADIQGPDVCALCEPGPFNSVLVHVYGRSMHIVAQVPAYAQEPIGDRVWSTAQQNAAQILRLRPVSA